MLLGFHLLSEGKRLRINVVGEDVLTVSVPLKRSMLDLPLKRGLYGAAFPLNCRCLCRTLLHSDAHAESRLLLISSHQLAPLLHTRPSQLRLTELDPRPELEDRFGSSCYTSAVSSSESARRRRTQTTQMFPAYAEVPELKHE